MKKITALALIGVCALLAIGCRLTTKDSASTGGSTVVGKDSLVSASATTGDLSDDHGEVEIDYEEKIEFWGDIYFLESSTDEIESVLDDEYYDDDARTYFNCVKMVKKLPKEVTFDNFVAYRTIDGSSSHNTQYVIYKSDGWLKNFIFRFNCGDEENHTGYTFSKTAFIEEMNNLELSKGETNHNDGGHNSYGILYFEKDGKVYGVYTNNIFADYE